MVECEGFGATISGSNFFSFKPTESREAALVYHKFTSYQ